MPSSQQTLGTAAVASCRALIDLIADTPPFGIPAADLKRIAYANGSLLRSRALLEAMVLLYENQREDTVSVPFRSLYEAWLTGLLFLKGKERHISKLEADDRLHYNPIAKRVGAVHRDGPEKVYPIETRTKSLAKLLKEENAPNYCLPIEMYDSVYANESLTGVHGGITSVTRYFRRPSDDSVEFILDPGPDALSAARLIIAADLTYSLTYELWAAMGVATESLDAWKAKLPDWRQSIPEEVGP